jgi:hypothetical protein
VRKKRISQRIELIRRSQRDLQHALNRPLNKTLSPGGTNNWFEPCGGAAEVWLAQQTAFDLWQARQATKAARSLSQVKALKLQTVA